MRTFRSTYRFLLPSWLVAGDGGKVFDALTQQIDDSISKLREAVYARFPSYAQDDALELIGKDRAISRGRTEPRKNYASRLRKWRQSHRVRGTGYALAEQVRRYFGVGDVDGVGIANAYTYTVDRRGTRYAIDPNGYKTRDTGFSWDWDGEPLTPNWGRFWVVIQNYPQITAGPKIGDPTLWSGTVGPGSRAYTIGQSGVTPDDVAAIRNLVLGNTPWKPGGTRAEWVIVMFGGGWPSPTGDWQNQANRNPAYRYWSLLP